MTRFDYLGDPLVALAEHVRSIRVSEPVRTPLVVCAGVLFVIFGWWVVEQRALADAAEEVSRAQSALALSRAALARFHIVRENVDRLVSLDRQVVTIRASGSIRADELVDVANHLPANVWLTTLTDDGTTLDMSARATSFADVPASLQALASAPAFFAPALVRAIRVEERGHTPIVDFELRADSRHAP